MDLVEKASFEGMRLFPVGFDTQCQYSYALRLTSELVDLRAWYANHVPHLWCVSGRAETPIKTEKDTARVSTLKGKWVLTHSVNIPRLAAYKRA